MLLSLNATAFVVFSSVATTVDGIISDGSSLRFLAILPADLYTQNANIDK